MAMLASALWRCWREATASMNADVAPMATAGAGPNRAIARTIARNAPDNRRLRISTITRSLVMASTRSSRSRESGCQSAVRLTVAAAPADDTSRDLVATTNVVRVVNTSPVIGTLTLCLSLTNEPLDALSQELE